MNYPTSRDLHRVSALMPHLPCVCWGSPSRGPWPLKSNRAAKTSPIVFTSYALPQVTVFMNFHHLINWVKSQDHKLSIHFISTSTTIPFQSVSCLQPRLAPPSWPLPPPQLQLTSPGLQMPASIPLQHLLCLLTVLEFMAPSSTYPELRTE